MCSDAPNVRTHTEKQQELVEEKGERKKEGTLNGYLFLELVEDSLVFSLDKFVPQNRTHLE